LNPFVAMLVVGFLSVVFYRQTRPGLAITTGMATRIGALSGLLWFAVSSILEAVVILVLHKGPEIRQALVSMLDQTASRAADPEAQALLARLKTPEGIEFLMIFGLILGFVSAIVLAAVGGALGGALFRGRSKG
jgi:membrane-bound ClpP family serine protease